MKLSDSVRDFFVAAMVCKLWSNVKSKTKKQFQVRHVALCN